MNIVRYAAAGASALAIIAGATLPAGAAVVPPPVDCLAIECGPAVVKPQPSTLTLTAVKNCASLAYKNPSRVQSPGLVVHPYTYGVYKKIPESTLVTLCLQAAGTTTSAERANTISWAYAKLGQRLTGVPYVAGTPTRATLVGAAFAAVKNPVYIPYPAGGPKISTLVRNTVSNDERWTGYVTEKYGARTTLPGPVSVALPPSKPGDVVEVSTTVRYCISSGGGGDYVHIDLYDGCQQVSQYTFPSRAAGLNAGNNLTLTLHNGTVTLVPTGFLTDVDPSEPNITYGTQTRSLRTYTMPVTKSLMR